MRQTCSSKKRGVTSILQEGGRNIHETLPCKELWQSDSTRFCPGNKSLPDTQGVWNRPSKKILNMIHNAPTRKQTCCSKKRGVTSTLQEEGRNIYETPPCKEGGDCEKVTARDPALEISPCLTPRVRGIDPREKY
ncbi:hypothetical protein CDAR_49341 [Caerostris darwini]|uniref:Uncharacterized protein n=1 Tax=Caerostris darwini TaxID=1538125 RepID=A0AAV4Q7T4_9ARAC|nr:hypothetical protein CDAR_49341 [Caerostris darwini]